MQGNPDLRGGLRLTVVLLICTVPVVPAVAQVSAACCRCGDMYVLSEDGFGFAREHVGMCGECVAEFETKYGELAKAAEQLAGRARGLGEAAREIRIAYNEAVNRRDETLDRIYGFNGSAAKFFNEMMGVALIKPGSSKALDWLQTGIGLAQEPGDWKDWAGIVTSRKVIELGAGWNEIADVITDLQDAGPIELAESIPEVVERFTGGMNEYTDLVDEMKGWDAVAIIDAALTLYEYGEACNEVLKDLADWRLAKDEMADLQRQLDEIDAELDRIGRDRACILAEIENRKKKGDSGETRFSSTPTESQPPPNESEPEEVALMVSAKPQPDAEQVERAERLLKDLSPRIDAINRQFRHEVLPVLLMFSLDVWTENDIELISEFLSHRKPAFESFQVDVTKLVDDGTDIARLIAQAGTNAKTDAGAAQLIKVFPSTIEVSVAQDALRTPDLWLVPAGSNVDAGIPLMSDRGTSLQLPAGRYDICGSGQFSGDLRSIVYQEDVIIADGENVSVNLDSGIRLATAEWAPARDINYGFWGVIPSGSDATVDEVVHWTRSDEALLLPPGAYNVVWVQSYGHLKRPLVLASNVQVKSGSLATVNGLSGLSIQIPDDTPGLDYSYGWWGVVRPGADPNDPIHWSKIAEQPLVLPPGRYDIVWKQKYSTSSRVLTPNVVVERGKLVEIAVDPR